MAPLNISGVHMHYYAVCKRKLWLYGHGITMEQEYDRIIEGNVLHECSYNYLGIKELLIDNTFKIDAIDQEYVREVKLTSRMMNADRLQLVFYLYQLELRGVTKKGLLSYPKERKTKEVILDDMAIQEIRRSIAAARAILSYQEPPPTIDAPICKKCAYYNFCYAAEEGE